MGLAALEADLKVFMAAVKATSDAAATAFAKIIDDYHTSTPAGAAESLATTGASVDVSGSAPPSAGDVLTATDATHATWQAPSGGSASMTQWMSFSPEYCNSSNGIGSANRIRTYGVVLPCQISLSKFVARRAGSGGGSDLAGFGLYDTTGALIARTGAENTSNASWGASAVKELAINGAPVTVPAGTYILAWTSDGVNCSFYEAVAEVSSMVGCDEFYAYTSTTSAAGILPATIALSFTHDTIRGRIWAGLRD